MSSTVMLSEFCKEPTESQPCRAWHPDLLRIAFYLLCFMWGFLFVIPTTHAINPDPLAANTTTVIPSPLPPATKEIAKPNEEPDKCQEVVNLIRSDIKKYSAELKTKAFVWKNLSWMQDKLGTNAKITPILQTLSQWENFGLLTGGLGTMTSGNFVGKKTIGPPTFEDATDVLGKPNNTETEILNKMTWSCKTNSEVSLVMDDDGNIVEVSGKDCSALNNLPEPNPTTVIKDCEFFSASLFTTKLAQKLFQNAPPSENKIYGGTLMEDTIHDYNIRYKTNIKDTVALESDIIERLRKYYRNLRTCTPGVYLYTIPASNNLVYYESKIKGLVYNQCSVETNFITPDNENHQVKCQFFKQNLPLFTDEYADSLGRGNAASTSPALQEVFNSQCQYFVNGKEVQLEKLSY